MDKIIHDPVHGAIKVSDEILRIIDTPQFQRLRGIKQLGFANLVYPGANHTRFEHSLGTMHLARILAEKLGLGKEVVISALLHDIAHFPFSHSGEGLLKNLAMTHENVELAIRGELKEVIDYLGFSVREIRKIVSGEVQSIVCGDVDVDRMDYLVRDSHYTGVAYGIVDLPRLLEKIKFSKGIVVEEGGIRAVESLLISRFLMYPAVYYHHVCRIATKMFERAIERIIEKGLKPETLVEMNDCEAMELLRKYEPDFYSMIRNRKLFKRAVYVGRESVDLKELAKMNERRVEKKIAEMTGVDERFVIVDIPEIKEFREFSIRVEVNGALKKIEEISSIVRSLRNSWLETWRLGVYAKKDFVEEVKKCAVEYLGIERRVQTQLFNLPAFS